MSFREYGWLRPETALWDEIAVGAIREVAGEWERPSLDLGCGNGVFSFLLKRGELIEGFDAYRDSEPAGFGENADIYDHFNKDVGEVVLRAARCGVDVGVDHKKNLLSQAARLGLYERLVECDASEKLPFRDWEFQTVFTNILYWLPDPVAVLRELRRVCGGRVIVCAPTPWFLEYCRSYRERGRLWEMVNRGRKDCLMWTASSEKMRRMADEAGFRVVAERGYLCRRVLEAWDIGLRPLSGLLQGMIRRMSEEDRLQTKREWVAAAGPFMEEGWRWEQDNRGPCGFGVYVLV